MTLCGIWCTRFQTGPYSIILYDIMVPFEIIFFSNSCLWDAPVWLYYKALTFSDSDLFGLNLDDGKWGLKAEVHWEWCEVHCYKACLQDWGDRWTDLFKKTCQRLAIATAQGNFQESHILLPSLHTVNFTFTVYFIVCVCNVYIHCELSIACMRVQV